MSREKHLHGIEVWLLVAVVFTFTMTGAALAETKSQSGWTAYTSTGGAGHVSQSYGPTRYYYFVSLRAWGGAPNPLKENPFHAAYNAPLTNIVTVWNGYNGGRYPAQHINRVFPGGSEQTVYTSGSGLASNSSAACFYYGISSCG